MDIDMIPASPAAPAPSRLGLATALALAALLAAPAQGAETAPGLRVGKDPVTGKLRAPTAAESSALDQAERARSGGPRLGIISRRPDPQAVVHPDGTIEQELDDSTLSYTVATRSADGSTHMACVTGAKAAQQALKGRKAGAGLARVDQEHVHADR